MPLGGYTATRKDGHEGVKQDSQCENGVGRRNRHERECRGTCQTSRRQSDMG